MPRYTAADKSFAVAAYRRFGLRPAERWLGGIWEQAPVQMTLLKWAKEGIVGTEEDELKLSEVEQERKSHIMAGFFNLMDAGFDLAHEKAKDGNALGWQQAIFGLGIAKDKQFPEPKTGMPALIGNATGPVQIVVAAAPHPQLIEHRDVPSDYDEASGARDLGDISVSEDEAS